MEPEINNFGSATQVLILDFFMCSGNRNFILNRCTNMRIPVDVSMFKNPDPTDPCFISGTVSEVQ